MVNMPANLIKELEKSLQLYSLLKSKFRKKFNSVPFTVLKANNWEHMQKVLETESKTSFVERAYQIGFTRGKKPYTTLNGRIIEEFDQAKDYVKLLFCFDDAIHQTITQAIQSKQKLKPYYKYISSIGE